MTYVLQNYGTSPMTVASLKGTQWGKHEQGFAKLDKLTENQRYSESADMLLNHVAEYRCAAVYPL